MSAITENATSATPAAQPEVAQPTGNVAASDAFKDVTTTNNAAATVPTTTTVPETKPIETSATATGAAAEPPTTEEKVGKKETQITATPITSGVVGYKAPGLMSQLRFKPHYLELGDAPVPTTDLTQYLRGEKPDVAHPTAAWSSVTGKGLLYISKNEESKKSPGSILNLADATNVSKEGDKVFSFRLGRHKHTFEAKSQDERNGFLTAIESTHESAAKGKDEIQNTQGYKDTMTSLNSGKTSAGAVAAGATGAAAGGAGAAAAATHTNGEHKESEKKVVQERRKSDSSDEKKKSAKSRSRSNKRSSIFGGILGKKDQIQAERQEKKAGKENEKEIKDDQKQIKQEEKAIERDEASTNKKVDKEEQATMDAIKKEEVQAEKEQLQAERAAGQAAEHDLKQQEKAIKAEEKDLKKEEKKLDRQEKVHDKEATAAGVAGTAGVASAAASKPEKDHDMTQEGIPQSQPKRKSILSFLDKAKSPKSEKKESDVMPATGGTTATSATGPTSANAEAQRDEQKAADALKHDPVPAEPTKKDAAAPTVTTGTKTDTAKTDETASPSGTSKRTSILGSVFRRNSKQAKSPISDTKKDETAATTPATVPETSETAPKIDVAPTEATNATSTDASKTGEHSIGDVVPDAVTVGQPTEAKPVGTTA